MKRRYSRIEPGQQATLIFPLDTFENCPVEDLSLTGMFVKGIFQDVIGKYCFVFLAKKEDQEKTLFHASAQVVRNNEHGIALEFTTMTIESYMFLQVVLLYKSQKPLDVMLELPDNCPFEIVDHHPEAAGRNPLQKHF